MKKRNEPREHFRTPGQGVGCRESLTSNDLHVEPQPPQGLLGIEVALNQFIEGLWIRHGDGVPSDRCGAQ